MIGGRGVTGNKRHCVSVTLWTRFDWAHFKQLWSAIHKRLNFDFEIKLQGKWMLFRKSHLWFCNKPNGQRVEQRAAGGLWEILVSIRTPGLLLKRLLLRAGHSRAPRRRFDLRIHLLSWRHFTAALFKEAATWHADWSGGSRSTVRCTSLRTRERPSSLPRRGATMSRGTRTSTRWGASRLGHLCHFAAGRNARQASGCLQGA